MSQADDTNIRQELHLQSSLQQERLWLTAQLNPYATSHNISLAMRLHGQLDEHALTERATALLRTHQILRTCFQAIDGDVTPITMAADEVAILEIEDLQSLSQMEQQLRVQYLLYEQPLFDLSQAPLLRLIFFRLSDSEAVLFVNAHRIVADTESISVILQELFTEDNSVTFENKAKQYDDFVTWQQQLLTSPTFAEHQLYWRQQLADSPPPLRLPMRNPAETAEVSVADSHLFSFSPHHLTELRQLSETEGVSLFAVVLTALKVVIYRYTEQTDMVLGTPFSLRNTDKFATVIGPLQDYVPLRTQLSPEWSLRHLLQQVQQTVSEAFAHQYVPLEKITRLLQPEITTSDRPPLQIVFAMEQAPTEELQLSTQVTGHLAALQDGLANFDLRITLSELPSSLTGVIDYDCQLFAKTDVARMIEHLQNILAAMTTTLDTTVAAVPILSDAEVEQLVVQQNDTTAPYPQALCVHQLISVQAERTPQAIAIVVPKNQANSKQATVSLTYQQLDEQSNQLAHYLQKQGIGPNSIIGICVDRTPLLVVGLLGILKSGAAYVPLDPTHPQRRLARIIEDTQAPILISETKLADLLPATVSELLFLDTDWSVIAKESSQKLPKTASAASLAYVVYVPNEYGNSSGVQVSHQSLTNLLTAITQTVNIDPADNLLALAAIALDKAVLELFLPLTIGGRVILADRDTVADPQKIVWVMLNYGVTVLQAPPSMWRKILATEAWTVRYKQLKAICGGEPLTTSLAAQLLTKCHTVWNLYGTTETTIWSIAHQITLENIDHNPRLIGRPLNNTQTYILDTNLQPTPINVPGILFIGGDGVSLGYLKQPLLTSKRFVSLPFLNSEQNVSNTVTYNTGDTVRYTANGEIEFLGRRDRQVKPHGFRAELREIEAVLLEEPSVEQATVQLREVAADEKRLIAYVTSQDRSPTLLHTLRQSLQTHLPHHLIPEMFIFTETTPLPDPSPNVMRLDNYDETHITELDPLELQIIAIVEDVFNISSINIRNNFLIVSHNLMAIIRLQDSIKKIFKEEISLEALTNAPTVKQLTRILKQRGVTTSWTSLVLSKPKVPRHPLFLIHHGEGSLTDYANIVKNTPINRPVYGVESPGWQYETLSTATIRQIAAEYVQKIRQTQPQGGYILGGYRAGGVIAFEAARQLKQQGRDVDLLILIAVTDVEFHSQISVIKKLKFFFGKWFRNSLFKASSYTIRKIYRKLIWHLVEIVRTVARVIFYKRNRQSYFLTDFYTGNVLLICDKSLWEYNYYALERVVEKLIVEKIPTFQLNLNNSDHAQAISEKLKHHLDHLR